MAQQTTADERTAVKAPENENSTLLVYLANSDYSPHDTVQRGEPIADHPAADDAVYVEGTVECLYSDEKYLLQTPSGHRLIVTPDEVRQFDGEGVTVGRPVYQVEQQPEDTYEGEVSTELGADVSDLVEGL